MPRPPERPIHLRSARMLDVVAGDLVTPGRPARRGRPHRRRSRPRRPADAEVVDLGDLTLLPGLMDMEVNLFLGGPDHGSPLIPVQEDPAVRTLRAVANAKRTLRSGFTTVRNLGLFVQTSGLLLDVALAKAIDLGWVDGPRVVPAGHAICPTGGHLDPTMFQAFAPNVLPLTVEEGLANGVDEVRKAVRYQIKYGARVIKVCASNGVMSHTGPAGAQQYSDEELAAVVDEAHRAGRKVAAHCMGDDAHPRRARRRHRLHRARLPRLRRGPRPDEGGGDLPRRHHLPDRRHGSVPGRPRAPGQGRRHLPPGPGTRSPGRSRRARRSPAAPTPRPSLTAATPRSCWRWWTGA